jgi:hypothetical protein
MSNLGTSSMVAIGVSGLIVLGIGYTFLNTGRNNTREGITVTNHYEGGKKTRKSKKKL